MIYWGPNQVPELNGLPKADKKRLFKQTIEEGKKRLSSKDRQKNFLRAIIAGIVLIFVLAFLFMGLKNSMVKAMIAAGLVSLLINVFIQSPTIEAGREWLREQGYPKN